MSLFGARGAKLYRNWMVTELISPVEEEKDSIGILQDTTVLEMEEVSMLSEKDKKTEAAMGPTAGKDDARCC